MPRYIIERDIPGVGGSSADQCRDIARRSNDVLRELGPGVRWQHSYLAGDKTFCVYEADDEQLIREHAKRSGFPVTRITRVVNLLYPETGQGA